MIIFINGKIGGGSPPAGLPFWMPANTMGPGFVDGAIRFFQDTNFQIPAVDFPSFSTVKNRFDQGYQFWTALKSKISINPHEPIHLVAHSMGCAFAEGLALSITKDGFSIGKVGYINCYQAGRLAISTDRLFTIDFQLTDDPLINNPILHLTGHAAPGAIEGATYQLRASSGIKNPLKRHRAPIAQWGYHFWPLLFRMCS